VTLTGPAAAAPATRIAMWSGPRTVSTALMRSWENRPDTVVADEPLYAFYLDRTGLVHPGRDEVIASQPTDWRVVLAGLAAPLPSGAVISYAEAHDPPPAARGGPGRVRPVAARAPDQGPARAARLLRPGPRRADLDDLGLRQQAEIFEAFGGPVVDSGDLLADPAGVLAALCRALGVPFDARMLAWPPGPRDSDGVWAPYWYDSVRSSTGFVTETSAGRPPPRCPPASSRWRSSASPTTTACTAIA
jgi:hypothetical protein